MGNKISDESRVNPEVLLSSTTQESLNERIDNMIKNWDNNNQSLHDIYDTIYWHYMPLIHHNAYCGRDKSTDEWYITQFLLIGMRIIYLSQFGGVWGTK